jgi:hypothetical protein
MSTGQYPKRRESGTQAEQRVERIKGRNREVGYDDTARFAEKRKGNNQDLTRGGKDERHEHN